MNNQASALCELMAAQPIDTQPVSNLRCLAIGSGKGGVGKTMISVSLAHSLAQMKFKTLLVDADLGLANVDLQMGLSPKFTLQDVIFGNSTIQEAVISVPGGPDVLAASSGVSEMADLGTARQQMLVDELISFARQYSFMIVDVGAGIGNSVTSFLSSVPEVAVVVANEPTSIMDAYSLIKVLSQHPNPPALSLIVNMVHSLDEGQLLASRLNTITERFLGFTIRTAGIVMYDRLVGDAIRARTPTLKYAESSAVSHCIREIAREIAYKYPDRARLRSERFFFGSLTGVGTRPPEGAPPP